MKSFVYNGMTFTPKRKFKKEEANSKILSLLKSTGIGNYDWSDTSYDYNDFYKEAKKVGAEAIDVFEYEGVEVVPTENELSELYTITIIKRNKNEKQKN